MRRFGQLLFAQMLMILLCACSVETDRRSGKPEVNNVVTVYSTTDTAIFQPVIADFRKLHPDIRLDYVELDSQPLVDRFLRESRTGKPRVDIVFSSAMDLQVKLVNDGYAQKHLSANSGALPAWAKWRNEIFGLTFEPVVMVANPALFSDLAMPKTRLDLVQSLRAEPAFWRGRIGTYDIGTSSVGYLLAGQDARQSNEYGALVAAMGEADARTYQNVSVVIDDIAAGKVALGYNVLGSYAKRKQASGAKLQIIYPEDYTLAVIRAAFIAKHAPNPKAAHLFLDYLMSLRGQRVLATRSGLAAVREDVSGRYASLDIDGAALGPLRPIPIGPGLMTYLDQQKRQRFLANWQAAWVPEENK
jgi:iron(III) transport system substrate-binding protein